MSKRRIVLLASCLTSFFAVLLLGAGISRSAHMQYGIATWIVVSERDAAALLTAVPPDDQRLFGEPLPQMQLDDSKAVQPFQAAAYRRNYPKIADVCQTDAALAEHYLQHGLQEHRVPQRLRVVATYVAAAGLDTNVVFGGLCNQIYSHVTMLALALQLGAEVVLRDAVHRGGRGFQDRFFHGEVQQVHAPLDTLFDVDHLLAWGASVGAVLHREAPAIRDTIEVDVPGHAICCLNTMNHVVGVVRDAVLEAVSAFLAADTGRSADTRLPTVLLNFQPPRLMFSLRTDTSHTELIEEVARNLRPSPRVQRAADAIVAKLTARGANFNGVHLRIEEDSGYPQQSGGQEALMDVYVEHMQASNYSAASPLYVASGLLTYMTFRDFERDIASKFARRGVCDRIVVKEQLLQGGTQLGGLLSEALAMVDLLVLVHARHFTGFAVSSYSWIVQEYRCFRGSPSTTSVLIEPPWNAVAWYFTAGGLLSNHSRTCPAPATTRAQQIKVHAGYAASAHRGSV